MKKWKLVLCLLLVSATIICVVMLGILLSNFRSAGVHILGQYAHVKL